jgi:hypothetical protein
VKEIDRVNYETYVRVPLVCNSGKTQSFRTEMKIKSQCHLLVRFPTTMDEWAHSNLGPTTIMIAPEFIRAR